MFNAAEVIIDAFIRRLDSAYVANFGKAQRERSDMLGMVARCALERLADTDALYHDLEHTIMVTLVGEQIARGKRIKVGGVTPDDWLHFVTALLCHDIGYVRGVCLDDAAPHFVANERGDRVDLPRGATDAALTPYHVDRGKIFVRERLGPLEALDVERLTAAIELTRFPVPQDGDHDATDTEPGLLRAADLIGQLADPNYMRKINALFREFEETGIAEELGYHTPAGLAESYPRFFWKTARPYILDALEYLRVTQEGKQWIANLYAHVFAAEHGEVTLGPERNGATRVPREHPRHDWDHRPDPR